MRLPESQIKFAILHAEDEVRLTAVRFFSEAFSRDETIMLLVIQAVEQYGRENSYRLLRTAEPLLQTEPTIEWLMEELRREYDEEDLQQDNYRFAIAVLLCRASPDLLASRESEILALPAFPPPLHQPLTERIEMFSWDWERAWQALERFGIKTRLQGKLTKSDGRYIDRLIETLARHEADHAAAVLVWLEELRQGTSRWLDPWVLTLAGAMQLEAAIPVLVQQTHQDEEVLADAAWTALQRIGTDAVVRALEPEWYEADPDWRASVVWVLEHIHTDLSSTTCLRFLMAEEYPEVQIEIANALLGQFSLDAIEPVWRLLAEVDEEELSPEERDLGYRLVAVGTIMGKSFPTFEQWHQEALRDNWGWFDLENPRLAEAFQEENGPSGNGQMG